MITEMNKVYAYKLVFIKIKCYLLLLLNSYSKWWCLASANKALERDLNAVKCF